MQNDSVNTGLSQYQNTEFCRGVPMKRQQLWNKIGTMLSDGVF